MGKFVLLLWFSLCLYLSPFRLVAGRRWSLALSRRAASSHAVKGGVFAKTLQRYLTHFAKMV